MNKIAMAFLLVLCLIAWIGLGKAIVESDPEAKFEKSVRQRHRELVIEKEAWLRFQETSYPFKLEDLYGP